ncbi:GIY-YIG nuclease family protein [Buttiauxella gaviniae]|uniref:GIY-YIG nuclease family protein n=1 Tax=Buttiauxella gaviniae TaxID=82990 RepID=UPI0039B0C590
MSSDFFGLERASISGRLASHYRENGWIYVLSNPSLPGVVKIGMTTTSPEIRAAELSRSTSVPTPFIVESSFFSRNPLADEKYIHHLLANRRVSDRREFFRCTPSEAEALILEEPGLTSTDEEIGNLPINYHVVSMDSEEEMDARGVLRELKIEHFGSASSCLYALAKLGAELVRDKNKNHLQSLLIKGGELHCLECREDT